MNSKEASGKACEIWLALRLLKDIATFQILQTWIGYNAVHYHNLNVLPHLLLYILSGICLVLGYLQWVTTCLLSIFLKKDINKHFF